MKSLPLLHNSCSKINGTISITESRLQGITAKHFGGALYSTIGISIVISDSEFNNNNAFSNGIKNRNSNDSCFG